MNQKFEKKGVKTDGMNYHPHFYEMEMVSMIRQGPQQRLVHAAANTSRSRRCRGCLALRFVCGRTSCT